MEIQVTRLVLMVVVVLPQLLQQSGAQLPGLCSVESLSEFYCPCSAIAIVHNHPNM